MEEYKMAARILGDAKINASSNIKAEEDHKEYPDEILSVIEDSRKKVLQKFDPKDDGLQVSIVRLLDSQAPNDCSNQSMLYVKITDIASKKSMRFDVRDLERDYKVLKNLIGIGAVIRDPYRLKEYILSLIKDGHVDLYGFTRYGKILLNDQKTIFLVNPETAADYNLEYLGKCSTTLKKKGDFSAYIQRLKKLIMPNRFFRMGICVAFSSIICSFLELFDTNFVLCLTGAPHTGKTTLTYFILSLFSNPKALLLRADSTAVGLEEKLDDLPCCPLSFDDSSANNPDSKTTKEKIMKVIFQIGSGTDRVKFGRQSKGTRYVNLIMSSVFDIEQNWSGEQDRGQGSRVLQVLQDKCGFTFSESYTKEVEDFMSSFYGLLFPEFCRRFSAAHYEADALKEKYKEWCRYSQSQAPMIQGRIHQRIAAVLTAADILNDLFEKESLHFDVPAVCQVFLRDPEEKAARHNDSGYYLERIKDAYRLHPEQFAVKRREFTFDAYKGIIEEKHDHYLFSVPQADVEDLMGADSKLVYDWCSFLTSTESLPYNRLSLKLKGSSTYSKHPFLTFKFKDKDEFFKKKEC
jgi:hypothetical protein